MADLVLVHSSDPAALLAHVAAPFCVAGRPAGPLPLVAVRQGGVRDALLDRAARAGCAGWLGAPVVVFHELPEVLAGPMAPLTAFERRALLVRAAEAAPGRALAVGGNGRGRPARGVLRALDALVGDLVAERVTPAEADAAFAALSPASTGAEHDDPWARLRDADVAAIYAAYVDALGALPPLGALRRVDGRDAVACAAEAVAAEPDAVRERLRVPFGAADAPRTVCVHGLGDLRRGWARLVGALHAAPFVDELRVSVLAEDVHAAAARHGSRHAAALRCRDPWDAADADADDAEPLGEDALAHALLARGPARVERAAPDPEAAARPAVLAHVQDTLLGGAAGAASALALGPEFERVAAPVQGDAPAAVRALAAPDVAREADLVARRVKRLLVEGDGAGPVAPHRVLVVSRQARPYGERVVEALRRYGVPVTARLRVALPRVGAVGALLRLSAAAAAGWSPASLGAIAGSPYFATGLDAAGLAAVARRRGWGAVRAVPLSEWSAAIAAFCDEADEDERAPAALGGGRAEALRDAFTAFAATVGDADAPRARRAWIDHTLGRLGRGGGGGVRAERERAEGAREGVFGLCRIACRAPHRDPQAFARDALAVDAVRRDVEGLAALGDALAAWRTALALGDGGAGAPDASGEVLTAAAWHDELAEALEDADLALTTPYRRGVQVAEASAAVWRTCDHLFVVGMEAGSFPAEGDGGGLFAAHERRALARAGLPVDAPDAWAAREASLWRTLAAGAARSLHLSYAAGDARGRPQLPSAYFDDLVGRLAGPAASAPGAGEPPSGEPASWVERARASAVAPDTVADAWCAADLHLVAAARAAADSAAARAESRAVLAHLAAEAGERALVAHVLAVAERERARAARRAVRPASLPRESVRAWNGAVTSPDLRAWLAARYGDRVWSAAELERYGRCPWDFFARDVLGVREPDAPPADADDEASAFGPRARGTLVHRVLELLHRGLAEAHGDAALTRAALRQADRLVPRHVERALAEAEADGQAVPPALRAVAAAELAESVLAYVAWEVEENERTSRAATPQRRPAAFEVAFGVGGIAPVTLTRDGRTLRLRGRIDRVDEFVDPALRGLTYAVDYKTSTGSLTPVGLYEHGGILQLPLYLHALGRLPEGKSGVWGGAYQIVKHGGARTAHLHLASAAAKRARAAAPGARQEEAERRLHDALDHALYHVDGIVAGVFPAQIPACVTAGCPPHCAVRDACREVRT